MQTKEKYCANMQHKMKFHLCEMFNFLLMTESYNRHDRFACEAYPSHLL